MEQIDNTQNATYYEEISYDKRTFKKVAKLRKKGLKYGIVVPNLNYELTKPEKPRKTFLVISIILSLALIGMIIALGFLYNKVLNILFETNLLEIIGNLFNPVFLAETLGLSAIPGLMILVVYIIIIACLLLPIYLLVYVYRFIRDSFRMVNCSIEEIAKGNTITNRITTLILNLIFIVIVFVLLLWQLDERVKGLLIVLFIVLCLIFGGLLTLILIERIKANKIFDSLEEDKKQNYLEHEKALKLVQYREKARKDFLKGR